MRTSFGRLKLKALYPAVLSGDIDTQAISVITLNGALHITHASRKPLPSLVEDACEILTEASAVSPLVVE